MKQRTQLPWDATTEAKFQKYQHDPFFGSTAKNHLIRLSAEMMGAMTSDKSIRYRIKELLAKAKEKLVS